MRISNLLAAALVFGALTIGAASAQTTYPLQCRGGGNVNVNIAPQASGGGTEIVIGLYDRATVTRALPAGSCSWLDRPLNSREPRAMRIIVRARMNVDFRPRAGHDTGDRAEAFVFEGSGPDVALARNILRVLATGGSFRVQARNLGHDATIATGFTEIPPP